jgi:hypothetical protein
VKKNLIEEFKNKFVAVGVEMQGRNAPYFFYGFLLEINDDNLLLELKNKSGYKYVSLGEIIDIHIDKNRRKSFV